MASRSPRWPLLVSVVLALVLGLTQLFPSAAQQPASGPRAGKGVVLESLARVPGHVVVKFQPSTAPADRVSVLGGSSLVELRAIRELDVSLVRTAPGDELAAIRRLQADPRVQFAEPNYQRRLASHIVPGDPLYTAGSQQSLELIGMPRAWHLSTGASAVVTAVIDTGIDLGHPDLEGRIANLTGAGLPGRDHVFLSSVPGDCPTPTSPDDDRWLGDGLTHGTHVAGIIAAVSTISGGPPVGIAGVAPGTRVAPLKVFGCIGHASDFDIADAMVFAAAHGAKIISMSLATNGPCPALTQSAADFAASRDALTIAAVGNDSTTTLAYPANCDHVLGVGATKMDDAHAPFSQRNAAVDIVAPGVDIWSTFHFSDGSRGYQNLEGTSTSVPHVAGCAALVRSVAPTLTAIQVEALLRSTAVDLGPPGRDDFFGSGRLDCGAAVQAAGGLPTPTSTRTSIATATVPPTGTGTPSPTATRTTTASLTPTMAPGGQPGRGFGVSVEPEGASLSWQNGTGHGGYLILRLGDTGNVMLPATGPLPPGATSYVDSATPAGLVCYVLLPTDSVGAPIGLVSDAVCVLKGLRAGSVPQHFTFRLNQSSTASLSWEAPTGGGQTLYGILALSGELTLLSGDATAARLPVQGFGCFLLIAAHEGGVLGTSDVLCGIAGFSNMGMVQAAGFR
jgi:subtilisin family serine protease